MNNVKLVYNVKDKPPIGKTIVFAFQQLLAIMAATIAVPAIIGHGMSASAALFGAGVGTLVYQLFTKFRSPVFLGSSFAFLGSMAAAFAGGVSMSVGYLGLIIGATIAGIVYVIIALVVKFVGVGWINKLMPAVVIGPIVAIIGLSLAGNAVGDLMKGNVTYTLNEWIIDNGVPVIEEVTYQYASPYIALICGLVTLGTTIACSVYGKKMMKMIPFIIGILAGYAVAAIFTIIGNIAGIDAFKIINFALFKDIKWIPDFTFITAFSGAYDFGAGANFWSYLGTIAVAYAPVAFVVFAEHIADHKNLSSIIDKDLLADPGLHRTLLGDGIGSIAGAFFGGCPNTTYGESVGCVAISGNASVITIFVTAIMAIAISFFGPFATFLSTIPSCVMGGVCIALYGFIAVSGLKMIQKVDLNENHNLFVVSVILIAGVGGLTLSFGKITITNIACALILGILTNVLCAKARKNSEQGECDKVCETCVKNCDEEVKEEK
ncbi:MAG: uracil-xanthine permease [Clostridia bacterium]|nr:uracil-xanthine permease [Clostridia bacterium]